MSGSLQQQQQQQQQQQRTKGPYILYLVIIKIVVPIKANAQKK